MRCACKYDIVWIDYQIIHNRFYWQSICCLQSALTAVCGPEHAHTNRANQSGVAAKTHWLESMAMQTIDQPDMPLFAPTHVSP